MLMGFAEFYAAGLRINLWRVDKLSSLQQEMMRDPTIDVVRLSVCGSLRVLLWGM